MLKKLKALLAGDPVEGIAAIDIAALEAALSDAQRKRAGLILDGEVDDILTAERAVDIARIELERGHLALAELERRKAEAEAQARRDALEAQRAEARAAVERVTEAITAKAKALTELDRLIGEAAEADKAAQYAMQMTINAHANDGFEPAGEYYLTTVLGWLSGRGDDLPRWYRAQIFDATREWNELR